MEMAVCAVSVLRKQCIAIKSINLTISNMSFTITDFLISIPITAIIIFAIILLYKRAKTFPTPMGCLLGCVIMFWFVLCFVGGCSARRQAKAEAHLAKIKLVSTGEIIKVPKADLVGTDSMFRDGKHVYKNDTGRDLVEYMVKYTKDGNDLNNKIYGYVISPDQYFYWYDDDESYRMFESPPASTRIVRRGRNIRSHPIESTYLTFLDYIENVPDYVTVVTFLKAE